MPAMQVRIADRTSIVASRVASSSGTDVSFESRKRWRCGPKI